MEDDRGRYILLDTDSANEVGYYESQSEALREVSETVALYGEDGPEVQALALIRMDVPPSEGHIAQGKALAALARRAASRSGYAHA